MTLKTLFSSRKYTVTLIVFLIAFVICGVAWMRFFAAIAANPSPVRYVDYVTAQGTRAPFRQDCAGPSFIENDAVWRFCAYDDTQDAPGSAAQWGMVRFDLAAGEGAMLWPLDQSPDAQVLALAKSSQGDLAVAWGTPDLSAITLLRRAGGVEALGLPDAAPRTIAGLAWTGDMLEIVAGGGDDVTVHVNDSGAWQGTRAITPPDDCAAEDAVCALQMAHRTDAGWRAVYAIAPRAIVGQDDVAVQFVAALEDGTPEPVDTIALADLDPAQYRLDESGNLDALGALFDQSPGNVVNWAIRAAPFVLHGGTWERVAAPQVDASFFFSDYAIDDGGLRWIPGIRYPQRSWQVDQWVTLRSSGDDIFLAQIGGDPGPTLTRVNTFAWQARADTTLLPASGGGYWVLGPNGAYMKADISLERADGLSLTERISRAFDNFTRLDDVNGTFYREQRALKMAAFPLVLLSLPFGYVLVVLVRQSSHSHHAWLLLLQVSALYVLVATGFFYWFWEIMDHF